MLWIERPALDFDASLPSSERYRLMTVDALQRGRKLLNAITDQIPPAAKPLADGVRLRTLDLALEVDADTHGTVQPAFRTSQTNYENALSATQGEWVIDEA